jgi:prophage regulatory protein
MFDETPGGDDVYLNVKQVAARYDVSTETIWRWKQGGDFPRPYKLSASCARWRERELKEWESKLTVSLLAVAW